MSWQKSWDEGARIVESLLAGTGFPMAKIEAVRAAIRTHMRRRGWMRLSPKSLRVESAELRSL